VTPQPIIVTAASRPVVQLSEVKDHLRILHTDEDALLEGYIETATAYFSWLTGVTVYQTVYALNLDRFDALYHAQHHVAHHVQYRTKIIDLPCASPLISVGSITYKNSDGVTATLSPSLYVVDTSYGRIAPAYGQSWPTFTPWPLSAVRIEYTAGRAITDAPPAGARECIAQLVGGLYENRESTVPTDRATLAAYADNPVTKRLLAQFKRTYAF